MIDTGAEPNPRATEGRSSDSLPFGLAIHYLGCARSGLDGVALPGPFGSQVEALAHRAQRVTVLAYEPPEIPTFEDRTDYVASGCPDLRLVSLGPKGTWRSLLQRRKRIAETLRSRSSEWDVLLLRLPNRRLGPVLKWNRCPRVVAFASGHGPSVRRTYPMPWRAKIVAMAVTLNGERLQRRALRKAGVALVNSESLLTRYRRLRADSELVRTSTRQERYRYLTEDRLEGPDVNVMICGRLSAAKGIFESLEAFAALKAGPLPTARLHVVGAGEDESRFAQEVTRRGLQDYCVFHGWIASRPALFELYRGMDVLLHLSYEESFPRAVWEALAHSVLVVCTPVGGLSHAFRDGREVLFVPPRDVDGAVKAVEQLAKDREMRSRLIQHGYERAQEASLERVTESILDAIVRKWPELLRPAESES